MIRIHIGSNDDAHRFEAGTVCAGKSACILSGMGSAP